MSAEEPGEKQPEMMNLQELSDRKKELNKLKYEASVQENKVTAHLRRKLHSMGAELNEVWQANRPVQKALKKQREPIQWSAITVAVILAANTTLSLVSIYFSLSKSITLPAVPMWVICSGVIAGAVLLSIFILAIFGMIICIALLMRGAGAGVSSPQLVSFPSGGEESWENHLDKPGSLPHDAPGNDSGPFPEDPDLNFRLRMLKKGIVVNGTGPGARPTEFDAFSEE